MSQRPKKGCPEYDRLSRRHFLGLTAGALAAAASPGWLPRVVLADTDDSSRDVMVSLFLRGGADALTLCVPYQEPAYYDRRPTLAIPAPGGGSGSVDLDGFFALPPAMAPLLPAYQDGALLLVHACGSKAPTRSHFSAMYNMEVGQADPPVELQTGWLGRHLASTAPTLEAGLLRAVGIGFGLQRTLVGAPAAIAAPDLDAYGLAGDPDTLAERAAALEAMYRRIPDPTRSAAANTLRTLDLLEQIDFASYAPSGNAEYPEGELGQALRSTAALIKAAIGVEAVAIDAGGWDTHDQQLPLEGTMAALMGSLAGGLAAFYEDLASAGVDNVTVVTMSEFGRNLAENASRGTDHGHGGLMMVLGGGVDGGRVLSDWPGLEPDQLYEGQDLEVTIDYRDVLTEIVTGRLGNPDFRNVFPDPDYEPTPRGVLL